MINTEEHKLKQKIIESALTRTYNYKEYRDLVDELASKGKTTGAEQKETLIDYTQLNSKRMKRWDKTFKLSDPTKKRIEKWAKPVLWLVLTESWCGDAAP